MTTCLKNLNNKFKIIKNLSIQIQTRALILFVIKIEGND